MVLKEPLSLCEIRGLKMRRFDWMTRTPLQAWLQGMQRFDRRPHRGRIDFMNMNRLADTAKHGDRESPS